MLTHPKNMAMYGPYTKELGSDFFAVLYIPTWIFIRLDHLFVPRFCRFLLKKLTLCIFTPPPPYRIGLKVNSSLFFRYYFKTKGAFRDTRKKLGARYFFRLWYQILCYQFLWTKRVDLPWKIILARLAINHLPNYKSLRNPLRW